MSGNTRPVLEGIERDLQAFADPGAPVVVESASAVWEQGGAERSIRFVAGPHAFPDVIVDDKRITYRAFLASESMADLKHLAEFIKKTDHRGEGFIETLAVPESDDGAPNGKAGPALNVVRGLATEDLPFLSTRVVLVRGEAGSGKTIVLRELASRQADHFLSGQADCLFFYVDAQGRALSRLEDAMAKDLQDLRSRFSYAAIAPLTRHQLVVPIIDGFDELLGSGGYDEAFSSLAAFLSTLEGSGSAIASARSAFFDYRNFYENARKFSGDGRLNYTVEAVDVLPWNEAQVRRYFAGVAGKYGKNPDSVVATLEDLRHSLDTANLELLTKPFYASRVASLICEGATLEAGESLLDQLVDAFLERELKKLVNKDNQPLLSKKGHRVFLTSLAEEMWWQESRRVDVGTVQAVAELVTEAFGLSPSVARAIVERVSSYAFLSTDKSERRFLRFEHEVFYGYFLAQKLQEYIEREPADLRRFLARSVLDETLVDQAVRLIGSDPERCSKAVEAITSILRPGLTDVVARENAGLLIAAIMRAAGRLRDGLTIRNVVFRKVRFGSVKLDHVRFVHCDLADVDLTHAVMVAPEFEDTALRNIEIDVNRTRMNKADGSVIDSVHGLTVHNGDRVTRVFAPDEVADSLRRIGVEWKGPIVAGGYPKKVQQRIDVLDRFVRKMERRFYATEEDMNRFPFAHEGAWHEVRKLLRKSGLLEEHIVDKSGPREPLLRLSVPPEVLRRGENLTDASLPGAVRRFWEELLTP